MKEIRTLTPAEVDENARLRAERSLSQDGKLVIGGFTSMESGFGKRLVVPLSEAQMEDETRDPGYFLELTFAQGLDLATKLIELLDEQSKGR